MTPAVAGKSTGDVVMTAMTTSPVSVAHDARVDRGGKSGGVVWVPARLGPRRAPCAPHVRERRDLRRLELVGEPCRARLARLEVCAALVPQRNHLLRGDELIEIIGDVLLALWLGGGLHLVRDSRMGQLFGPRCVDERRHRVVAVLASERGIGVVVRVAQDGIDAGVCLGGVSQRGPHDARDVGALIELAE